MGILDKIIQFFTGVKDWFIKTFTSRKMNIVSSYNHNASELEQYKELYQEFGSICDNAYELNFKDKAISHNLIRDLSNSIKLSQLNLI